MMTKRKGAWMGLAVAALASVIGIAVGVSGGTYTVRLTQEEVQQKIDQKLAHKDTFKKGPASIRVKNARAELTDRLLVHVDMEGEQLFKTHFSLSTVATGEVSYRDGEFFFTPAKDGVRIENFQYDGPPIAERIVKRSERYLTNRGLRNAVEDAAPHVEAWMKASAEYGATAYLSKAPIYRLKNDFKGIVAKAALEKVEIKDGKLAITFTIWHLAYMVVAWIFVLIMVLGFMFALMQSPGWGAVAIVGLSLS
jgi:hypothetical protein